MESVSDDEGSMTDERRYGSRIKAASQALNDYNSATDVGGFQTAQGTINTMNTYYEVGLLVGGASLAAVLVSFFLSPNVSSQDDQIHNINSQITLLGDSK